MPAKIRILIVDDDLPVCKSMASALAEGSYEVEMALSSEEALKSDRENPYDIIVADIMMPGMTGVDLLGAIKDDRPSAMVIMVTGYPSIKSAVQSVKMGAFDYLPKPFTPDELRATVSRALARKKLLEDTLAGATPGVPEVSIPDDTHFIPENSWVRVIEDGNVHIGVHHMLLKTVRVIESIEFPNVGEKRNQGDSCLWIIDDRNYIHRIWSPVTGTVVKVNTVLTENVAKLLNDPYRSGWVLTMSPSNLSEDLENLKLWGGS